MEEMGCDNRGTTSKKRSRLINVHVFDMSRLDALGIVKSGTDNGKKSLEVVEKIKNLVLDS